MPDAPARPSPPASPWYDAVRVPRRLGLAALDILGARAGAAVEDPQKQAVYFFIPAGVAATWTEQSTVPLSDSAGVPIPPARRTGGPGPHWRMCPGDTDWATAPDALRAALADALPRMEAAA
ncbi:hypothetical protein GTY23_02805 [Streptomyces sp. SID5998]|nr:hypothetical protein [Streptomyces sp. SID5998]